MLKPRCHGPAWRNMYVTTVHGRSGISAGTRMRPCGTAGRTVLRRNIPTFTTMRRWTHGVTGASPYSAGAAASAGGGFGYRSEAALPGAELLEGARQLRGPEFRPHALGEMQLRVRAFPEEEIAEPLLPPGADEEIHIRQQAPGGDRPAG